VPSHRLHEQDHAASDGQRSDTEVQHCAQQLAQHHEYQGHCRCDGQHLALHLPPGGRVKGSCDGQDRDQRELWPDTDQQYQECIDRTSGVIDV
jgi:hypothetical protein